MRAVLLGPIMPKVSYSSIRWLSSSRAIPFLFALYILPRVIILFMTVDPYSDAAWYFSRAVALSRGEGYSEGGVPTAYWPPGWPLTLAALFNVFGVSLIPIKIFNFLCSIAVGWLTYDLGRRLFESELVGRLSLCGSV